MTRVVTVDGPAGSGKSTLGRRLAVALELPFIDTGLLYRGLTVAAARAGIAASDDAALVRLAETTDLAVETDARRIGQVPRVRVGGVPVDAELYDPGHAELLASISSLEVVRSALRPAQRALAAAGAVAAGRDCGTVVFPDAPLKVYLQASEEVRSRRRAAQLLAGGRAADRDTLAGEIVDRDRSDSTRTAGPLKPAADAVIIDTGALGIEAMVERVLELCEERGLTL